MTTPLVITDHPTPDEVREALGHLVYRAKRTIPAVGTPALPTEWDRRHAAMDELLDLL